MQDMCIRLTITSPTVHLRISVVPFEMVYVMSNWIRLSFECVHYCCCVIGWHVFYMVCFQFILVMLHAFADVYFVCSGEL